MIKDYQEFDLLGKRTFVKAIIKPPFRLIAEMPNEACFYYVISGCAKIVSPAEVIESQSEEGLVLKCGNYLNEYVTTQEMDYCEAIAIHLYPDVLRMIYDKEFPDFLLNVNKIKPVTFAKVKASDLLKNYIENLQFYFDNPQLVSDELLKLKLKELVLLLAKTDNAEMIRALISAVYSKTEIDFKTVIESNLYNNFSLEELAALTSLSLSSFKREFTKKYNCSPAKYIKQRKLEKAAQLLKGTELRVSDIAFDCGFVDLAHFSKSFQKTYQVSPSEYRVS